jgi:hypothetical protein
MELYLHCYLVSCGVDRNGLTFCVLCVKYCVVTSSYSCVVFMYIAQWDGMNHHNIINSTEAATSLTWLAFVSTQIFVTCNCTVRLKSVCFVFVALQLLSSDVIRYQWGAHLCAHARAHTKQGIWCFGQFCCTVKLQ